MTLNGFFDLIYVRRTVCYRPTSIHGIDNHRHLIDSLICRLHFAEQFSLLYISFNVVNILFRRSPSLLMAIDLLRMHWIPGMALRRTFLLAIFVFIQQEKL